MTADYTGWADDPDREGPGKHGLNRERPARKAQGHVEAVFLEEAGSLGGPGGAGAHAQIVIDHVERDPFVLRVGLGDKFRRRQGDRYSDNQRCKPERVRIVEIHFGRR